MKWLGIILAVVAFGYGLFKLKYPTYTYRYRMTVNVDVDGEPRSGSSVIEIRVSKQPQFLPEVHVLDFAILGEATFVDLGRGQNLVGLLASGPYAGDTDYPHRIVPHFFRMNSFENQELAKLPSLRGKYELSPNDWPTFVTVPDVNNAESTHTVEPGALEKSFGRPVHLRSVVLELTRDSVTRTIGGKLPWIGTGAGKPHSHYLDRFTLDEYYFTRG